MALKTFPEEIRSLCVRKMHKGRRLRLIRGALFLIALVSALPAASDTEVETVLQAGLSDIQTDISPTGPISNTVNGTGFNGLSASTAFGAADFGILEVEHDSFAVSSESAGGFSVAYFRDDITINPDDPALIGTEGRIVFELLPMGVLRHDLQGIEPDNDSADGRATYRVLVKNAEFPGQYEGALNISPGFNGFGFEESFRGTPLGTPLIFARHIYFGSPRELEVALSVQANANITDRPPATASYNALASVSVAWEGILEVRDSADNVVADYSVSSGSGVDWNQPVPEPSFGLLLSVGLVGLAAGGGRVSG